MFVSREISPTKRSSYISDEESACAVIHNFVRARAMVGGQHHKLSFICCRDSCGRLKVIKKTTAIVAASIKHYHVVFMPKKLSAGKSWCSANIE